VRTKLEIQTVFFYHFKRHTKVDEHRIDSPNPTKKKYKAAPLQKKNGCFPPLPWRALTLSLSLRLHQPNLAIH